MSTFSSLAMLQRCFEVSTWSGMPLASRSARLRVSGSLMASTSAMPAALSEDFPYGVFHHAFGDVVGAERRRVEVERQHAVGDPTIVFFLRARGAAAGQHAGEGLAHGRQASPGPLTRGSGPCQVLDWHGPDRRFASIGRRSVRTSGHFTVGVSSPLPAGFSASERFRPLSGLYGRNGP